MVPSDDEPFRHSRSDVHDAGRSDVPGEPMNRNPRNRPILTSGNMAGNLASDPIDLSGSQGYAVQAEWSGVTGSGTLSLQVSCADPPKAAADWTLITSSVFNVASASGNDMWNILTGNYFWAQLTWTPATGGAAGVLNVRANTK
jgi:hypothetical protein